MDIFDLLYFIIILINFALAILILIKNPRSKINLNFAFFIFFSAIWLLTLALFYIINDQFWVLNIGRLNFVSVIWLVYFLFLFVCYFPKGSLKIHKVFTHIFLLETIILSAITYFSNLVDYNEIISGSERITVFGKLYPLFIAHFLFFCLLSIYYLWKKFKSSVGLEKLQLRYLLWGIILSLFLGFITNIFIPIIFSIYSFQKLGSFADIILISFIAYTIFKYRLMDVKIIFQNILTYLLISAFAYGCFYGVTILNNYFFGSVFATNAYLMSIIFAFIFVLIFVPFQKLIQKLTKHYLFAELYNTQKTINNLTNKLTTIIDLQEIIDLVVDTIRTTMNLNRSGVLLLENSIQSIKYQIAKVVGFDEHNGISLVQDSFLTQYLDKTQKPLVREELDFLSEQVKNEAEKQSFLSLRNHMNKIEASICLPLISQNKLVGIIVLGSKISGDAYTSEDLNLLTSLSNQASIAITNARYYKEIQEFNKNLQAKVDEQTKDIKLQSEHLQQLLDVKDDFLRVANHQLNTPLSVVRNALSMMNDNDLSREQAMAAITNGVERLNNVIGDFLRVYDLEGEKMAMKLEPTDIGLMIEKLLPEKQNLSLVKERNLKLTIEKPGFKMPLVFCDSKQIINVISNFLDNAVFYTTKGSVTVTYSMPNVNYLQINVIDTGAGISDEDKKSMFQKFVRGKGASQLHPDGSGLGLYIAKKIVEGNNGEIMAVSKGVNQGSVFSFTLPVFKNQTVEQKKLTSADQNIIIFEENIKNKAK